MMADFVEQARAKINLTLSVLGRRADGYHSLSSLVAFADIGDRVTLDPGGLDGLTMTGPFAAGIVGDNLVEKALRSVADAVPGTRLGHVTLDKQLPIASGIGGGSTDAAAVLRALRRAHPALQDCVDWMAVARGLGADVPVCFADRAVWMSGAGEQLHDLPYPLPPLAAVLVNPQAAVPHDKTGRVFRALGAPMLAQSAAMDTVYPAIPDRAELLALMHRVGNDLEGPATAVVPEIAAVSEALEACTGVEIVRLSGAGPTCFAVFETQAAARTAAEALTSRHPEWWVRASQIS
jgi:4-diphosphocytidyl-2-C-methyl-D-erythritol kinase